MGRIGKAAAIKRYFSTEGKPVTSKELIELMKTDKAGFDELALASAKALGEELDTPS